MSEPGSLIRTLSGRQSARNYHSYVINEVGLAIVSGAMPVSSILPNDAEMMDRFGVSRTVLREALKTLEAKGLVEARAKVGTRVLPQARWSLFDRQVLSWALEGGPSPAFVHSFLVVRRNLEAEAAVLAAVHRDNESMRMLHYWLNQRSLMAEQPEPFALAEFEIHRGVAETSANPFLRAASGIMEFGVALSVKARIGPALTVPDGGLAQQKTQHYADLLSAIETGNADVARLRMAQIVAVDEAATLATFG